MLITDARTAGTLAAQLDALAAQIAAIDAASARGSIISGGTLLITTDGSTIVQNLRTLTADESTSVFNTMLTILQARWNNLDTNLRAIS